MDIIEPENRNYVQKKPKTQHPLLPSLNLKVHVRVALAIVFLVGCVFVLATKGLHSWTEIIMEVGREIGILFISVTPIVLIYENILRNRMHSEMARSIKSALIETEPIGIQNMLALGISDASSSLQIEEIKKNLDKLKPGTTVTVSNIYIPSLKFDENSDSIFSDAIRRGCSFNILLADFEAPEALIKRSKAAKDGSELKEYKAGIEYNLAFLYKEWQNLRYAYERSRLNIRLHNDFLSVSSWGFGDCFIIGTYLHGRSAVKGTQIRVVKNVLGGLSKFYKELDRNFELQWKMAYKQIDFSKNGPGDLNLPAVVQLR